MTTDEQRIGELDVAVSRDEGVTIIAPSGEVDIATAPSIRKPLLDAIDAGSSRVVLDFTEVTFLDSTGLSAIISAQKRLPEGGLVIAAGHPMVCKVLDITGLSRLIAVRPTVAAALAVVRSIPAPRQEP